MVRAGARRRTARLWPLLSGRKPPSGFKQERDWKRPHLNKSLWLQRKDWATGKRNSQEAAEQACVYTHTHTRTHARAISILHAGSLANLSAHRLFIDRFFFKADL